MRPMLTAMMLATLATGTPVAEQGVQREPPALDPAKIERGVAVYAAQRCSSCHSIEGQGNRRYPLDGVGTRLTRDTIRKWIVSPQEMSPRVRKRAYDGLSDEDLDALVTYMSSLRARK